MSVPKTPLTPRTDNVPSDDTMKSPKSSRKSIGRSTDKNNSNRKSESSEDATSSDFLFGLSPTSFYKASVTPKGLKKVSDAYRASGSASAQVANILFSGSAEKVNSLHFTITIISKMPLFQHIRKSSIFLPFS